MICAMEAFYENFDAKDALQKFLESSQHSLLLIGPSGAGKTTLCQLAIDQIGRDDFQVMRPVYEDFATHKDLVEHLDKFVKVRNMLELFQNKRKLLFLDDLDTLMTQDRFANAYVQQLIDYTRERDIKMLMTCTSGQEKRVADIKKKVLVTKVVNPSVGAAIRYLRDKYGDCLDAHSVDDDRLRKFVRSMQSNIRCCEMNLRLVLNSLDDPAVLDAESAYRMVFDKNICEVVGAIFESGPLPAKTLDLYLSEDPTLISHIMYDNFFRIKGVPFEQQMRVINAYAVGSIMETNVYSKNDWFLNEACNLYRCGTLKLQAPPETRIENITYTTITTRASNYYNMCKRVGEHQSGLSASFAAIQRFHEIESGSSTIKSQALGRKHKEDSGLNNYIKRIHSSKRGTERKQPMPKKRVITVRFPSEQSK